MITSLYLFAALATAQTPGEVRPLDLDKSAVKPLESSATPGKVKMPKIEMKDPGGDAPSFRSKMKDAFAQSRTTLKSVNPITKLRAYRQSAAARNPLRGSRRLTSFNIAPPMERPIKYEPLDTFRKHNRLKLEKPQSFQPKTTGGRLRSLLGLSSN